MQLKLQTSVQLLMRAASEARGDAVVQGPGGFSERCSQIVVMAAGFTGEDGWL